MGLMVLLGLSIREDSLMRILHLLIPIARHSIYGKRTILSRGHIGISSPTLSFIAFAFVFIFDSFGLFHVSSFFTIAHRVSPRRKDGMPSDSPSLLNSGYDVLIVEHTLILQRKGE